MPLANSSGNAHNDAGSVWLTLAMRVGSRRYGVDQYLYCVGGWANSGIVDSGSWGLGPYFQAQDYFLGLVYAVGAAFTVWSLLWEYSRSGKRAEQNTGRVSWGNVLFTVGLVSFLWAVCFLVGCCGSPMLAVYAGLFGARAFGIGKPFVALITLLTVTCAYWCMLRRAGKGTCGDHRCCAR